MKSDKQNSNIENILELIKRYPNYEIIPIVDTECIYSEDYGSWMASWGGAKVSKYYCTDERIYVYEDLDEIEEDWIEVNYDLYPGASEKELYKMANDFAITRGWTDAIIVRIDPM